GVSTGALFLLIGMIYERTHSREISSYGGLAGILPKYSIAFFIILLSSIAVPMTNGFVGEFLILLGTYKVAPIYVYFAVTGVVLGAAYMLWMFKRVFFGKPGPLFTEGSHEYHDLSLREGVVLAPLLILSLWMGLLPQGFLRWSDKSVQHLVENKDNYYLEYLDLTGQSKTDSTEEAKKE
ncbi:MAG TPA: proton-conducting transporter membrane subunit, partial [Pseudobdellovibrionaceae bacterium]|nr:proton-conducting transporter membrane subunit [Pseudobdellovibrionaceae bacterium]